MIGSDIEGMFLYLRSPIIRHKVSILPDHSIEFWYITFTINKGFSSSVPVLEISRRCEFLLQYKSYLIIGGNSYKFVSFMIFKIYYNLREITYSPSYNVKYMKCYGTTKCLSFLMKINYLSSHSRDLNKQLHSLPKKNRYDF